MACTVIAYVLVVQSALAAMMVTQAAAADHLSGSFVLLCSGSEEGSPATQGGTPSKSGLHCPLCVLASTASGLAPSAETAQAVMGFAVVQLHFVSADACISLHRARAGLSQGPPKIV